MLLCTGARRFGNELQAIGRADTYSSVNMPPLSCCRLALKAAHDLEGS